MTTMGDSIRRRSGRGRSRARAGAPTPRPRGGELRLGRWILGGLAGALLAFGLGWLIATQLLFPKPALARDEVAVPHLQGMTLAEARARLADVGLELGAVHEMVHPSAPRGDVVAQDPLGGQRLKPGAEVGLALSQGRARVTVPDLAGMPAESGLELARRLGFQPERRDEPTVEAAGTVLRTTPERGTVVELPARLTVVVSAGGLVPDTPLLVPDSGAVIADSTTGKLPTVEGTPFDD